MRTDHGIDTAIRPHLDPCLLLRRADRRLDVVGEAPPQQLAAALGLPPPRSTRFGSPLVLSRVHWVRPEVVAEVKFLTWTGDNLLRQVVYEGLREDKPAREVCREGRAPKPARPTVTPSG